MQEAKIDRCPSVLYVLGFIVEAVLTKTDHVLYLVLPKYTFFFCISTCSIDKKCTQQAMVQHCQVYDMKECRLAETVRFVPFNFEDF